MLYEEKDILNTLFQVRDEEIAIITKQDKENLQEVNQRLKQEELEFKKSINYLPKVMKQNKRNIIDAFYKYLEVLNERNSYYDQKYYEAGFKDAFKLMLIALSE